MQKIIILLLFAFGFGQGGFIEHEIADVVNPDGIYVIDIDEDGDLDVLSAAINSSNSVQWYENDGFNNFTTHIRV